MEQIEFALQPRSTLGKKVKALRRGGVTPVHLYGRGAPSRSLQAATDSLTKLLTKAGRNFPINISIDGENGQYLTFVRQVQWDPINGSILHADFLQVDIGQKISNEIPIVLIGEDSISKQLGSALTQHLYMVEVEALPLDMPQMIEVDVSSLIEAGKEARVAEVTLPARVTMITNGDVLIARMELIVLAETEDVLTEEPPDQIADGQEQTE